MSFVRTLLLALVAAGLGAYLWFVEAPKLAQEAKADLLLEVDPATAEKVRLSYPDGTGIEVVKEDGQWMLTAPVRYRADNSTVENFLTTVKDTKIERRVARADAGALANYGLEGDTGTQARVEVTAAGGKPLPAIVLGIATPVGYQAFARREGTDEVLVIPLLLQSTVKKSPDELRFKTMFDTGSAGVKKVTIEKPGETIVLERVGTGDDIAWTMRAPKEDTADTESVRSMLDSLATIDAVAFFDGDKADRKAFGLEDGATRFTAERDDGAAVAFTLGKEATDQPAGFYFERASDRQVAKVSDWVATKFAPDANDLRDKRLLSCNADEIVSLAFSISGESFTLSRDAAGKPWKIAPDVEGQTLNQRLVDNAVSSLVLARADAVIGDSASDADLGTWALDKPVARLDVTATTGPCASLAASPLEPAPAPEGDPAAARRAAMKQFAVKKAGRSAVLRASEHEYSRIAMKRGAFVDAAPKAGGAASPPAAAAPAASQEAPAAGAGALEPDGLGHIAPPGAEGRPKHSRGGREAALPARGRTRLRAARQHAARGRRAPRASFAPRVPHVLFRLRLQHGSCDAARAARHRVDPRVPCPCARMASLDRQTFPARNRRCDGNARLRPVG